MMEADVHKTLEKHHDKSDGTRCTKMETGAPVVKTWNCGMKCKAASPQKGKRAGMQRKERTPHRQNIGRSYKKKLL